MLSQIRKLIAEMKHADKVGKKVEYYKCQECGKVWKNSPGKPQRCSCGAGKEKIRDFQKNEE